MNSAASTLLQSTVTFREGFEISLIVAMLLGFLTRTGRRDQHRAVWIGVATSAALCVALAVGAFTMFGELDGRSAMVAEASVMIAAAGVMTWMIFWMRRNARVLKGEIDGGLAAAATSWAVALFAATAVAREGFESVMILLSAGAQASPSQAMVAATIGFGCASLLGVVVYRGGRRLDLNRFFQVTGVALIGFAAYSLAYGMHELAELLAPAELVELAMAVGAPLLYAAVMLRWYLRPTAPATGPRPGSRTRERSTGDQGTQSRSKVAA